MTTERIRRQLNATAAALCDAPLSRSMACLPRARSFFSFSSLSRGPESRLMSIHVNRQKAIQSRPSIKRERTKKALQRRWPLDVAAGEKKKLSTSLSSSLRKKKNRIIALSVPQGAQAPSPTEAASLPCEATPLRLALEPRTAENKEGPVYAAVALAGGGVARLEVTLSPSDGGPTAAAAAPSLLLLRPGQRESKSVDAAERKAPEEKKLPSLPSPSEMRGAFGGGGGRGGGDSSKKREQQLQEDKEGAGGDGGGGGGSGNGSRHSPVGAAGRAVAGLTAAAVGAPVPVAPLLLLLLLLVEAVVVLVAADVAAQPRGRGPAAVDEGAAVDKGVGVLSRRGGGERERGAEEERKRGVRKRFCLLSSASWL